MENALSEVKCSIDEKAADYGHFIASFVMDQLSKETDNSINSIEDKIIVTITK